jgi:hypothetical protein
MNIRQVISVLPHHYVDFLLNKKYKVYSLAFPILEQVDDRYLVRFSLDELLASYPAEEHEEIRTELQLLTLALEDPANYTTVKLRPDECLIVNNRSCLHGRHSFEPNSKRVFYRARQYWRFEG